MHALPRGRCPICGTFVALRKGDLVREHREPASGDARRRGLKCIGSGRKKVP